MSAGTMVLAAVIAAGIVLTRQHAGLIRGVWREAHWWEKALLVVAVLPIPGPVDEIVGVLVIRRVLARGRR